VVTRIPFCYGAWVENIMQGGKITFDIRAWVSTRTRSAYEDYLYHLAQLYGSGPHTLSDGTYSYPLCHMEEVASETPTDTGGWVRLSLVQSLGGGG
jgi:hypothetical protein